jgi:hypothetical protein
MTEPTFEEITAAAKVLAAFNGYDAEAWSAVDEATRGSFRYDARLVLRAAMLNKPPDDPTPPIPAAEPSTSPPTEPTPQHPSHPVRK